MIATVTMNPAIDKTMTARELIPGRVNRMTSLREYAGGKGINVTKVLRQMDEPVIGMGLLGGFTGQFIREYMEGKGVDCRYTKTAGLTRTTLNILSEDGYVTEILEPGAEVSPEELDRFLAMYRSSIADCSTVVLSSSLPAGVPKDFYAGLIAIAKERGKRTVLDTSREALVEGIKACPFLIKPNVTELEYVVGRPLRTVTEIGGAIDALQKAGIAIAVVTRGSRGMMTVVNGRQGREILSVSVPDVHVVNTVGSGDVTVAVLSMELAEFTGELTDRQIEHALLRAAAVSAANVTTMESGVVPQDMAERLMGQVKAERIPF
ncbi:MAG: 1-phosphofructokinase family hexose kinase [Lachnospiraceae bacterium]|jgi:1-phosphofructokinase family hexose kinase|nr:1-phosphofructokinase family hexose kinase [Lachnospiraceae bacterium]